MVEAPMNVVHVSAIDIERLFNHGREKMERMVANRLYRYRISKLVPDHLIVAKPKPLFGGYDIPPTIRRRPGHEKQILASRRTDRHKVMKNDIVANRPWREHGDDPASGSKNANKGPPAPTVR